MCCSLGAKGLFFELRLPVRFDNEVEGLEVELEETRFDLEAEI